MLWQNGNVVTKRKFTQNNFWTTKRGLKLLKLKVPSLYRTKVDEITC
jgi:hypothetical protein